MNRKQLEDCAWAKTPKDERRAQRERYDWAKKKTVTERLKGNNREVIVFDPSGDTPGTMSPWVPLWTLYNDELEQRCKNEQQPKLRAPYHRTRPDYTSDVESRAPASSSRAHATRKKSPAQLDREIAASLAERKDGDTTRRRHHSTKASGGTVEVGQFVEWESPNTGTTHRGRVQERRLIDGKILLRIKTASGHGDAIMAEKDVRVLAKQRGPRDHSTLSDDERIREAIGRFPPTFGLRGFPKDVFRISPTSSYVDNRGRVVLYTQRRTGNQWLDFSKGSEAELKREVTP